MRTISKRKTSGTGFTPPKASVRGDARFMESLARSRTTTQTGTIAMTAVQSLTESTPYSTTQRLSRSRRPSQSGIIARNSR